VKKLLSISFFICLILLSALSWAADESPVGLVVIDPGHGGIDRGAIGPDGLKEKDLTLMVAKRLATILKNKYGFMVALTREDDTYVPLEKRTAMANSLGASLFISIHVNAALSPRPKGVETFFLSYDATDEEAVRLAAVENGFDPSKTGIKYEFNNDLKTTLLDLLETAAHHESSTLAEAVHTSIIRITRRDDRGVRQAPFAVLDGATMPAVLVELGFISNRSDEQWLRSKEGAALAARSIALGIADFENRTGMEVKRAGFEKHD